ncbi:hypothetical protein EDB19DRAFT_1680127 [Suillus lakei]|nr:hypothetical protein EDB19DRAFT_1680127 [Suillus lakei]
MSQWGQPGFQYPMTTGYPGQQQQQFQPAQNPQFQQQTGFQPGALAGGFHPGGIAPQPTGFPGARPQQGYQQPQQTGYLGPGPSRLGVLQAQPTGFPGESSFAQQARPQPPPVPPIPTQFQQQPQLHQQTGFANPQANRFGGPTPSGYGGNPGLVPQPTGFVGLTGYVDPRLQMMSSSFLPANVSAPYSAGGMPQLAAPPQQQLGGLSLQQSFQQHNQARGIGSAPKVSWTLSKSEKKQYDQIFRSWDAQGTGFISGQTALEVFGQSGIDKNDLARIWTLADADNRGKLNLAEFHVAMGLIFRKLNGNDIPDELPSELVPPSSRDLDTSVNFLKDILKNDTRARSPLGLDTPVSRLKERSFNSTSAPGAGGRQDATPPGGFYQPRSRHIDRSTVRSRNEDNSPTADMSDIKRQLANTQKMLDASALDREMGDLRYRIKRLQEDLESASKEEERRRLERELLQLMHEHVPELERKIQDRQARKEREDREYARERDRRNERSGRHSPSLRYRDDGRDRPYSRSASRYDRDDRDYDRDRSYRDRHDDRDLDRGLSTSTRTPPPPPPPAAPANNILQPPPPPPAPSRSPAPGMKNMTPEERKAFIHAQAKKRLEERMQALGVSAPSSTTSPTLDVSVEDRLAQEKKEAEEKAKEAERQAEERERLRRERLESDKAFKEGKATPQPTPTVPTPTTTAPPPAPAPKVAPPALKSRAPAPPPPRKGFALRPSATTPSAPSPAPAPPVPTPVRAIVPPPAPVAPTLPPVPAVPKEDPEDAALKAREATLRKKREEHAALLRKLEEEEEEARRAEEVYLARRQQFLAGKSAVSPTTPATPASPVPPQQPAFAPPPPPPAFVPAPPPPPPAPVLAPAESEEVAPTATSPPPPPPPPAPLVNKSSTNPFSRMMKEGGSAASTPTAANGSSNPFFLNKPAPPPTAPALPPTAPAPPKSPGPSGKTTYNTAGGDSEDDWDDVMENEENDSSDEELGSRDTRMGLAQQLFGNLLPSRPQSAGPEKSPRSPAPLQPPSAPPAPSAPTAPPAPPPPSAPFAPPPPALNIAAPTPTGDRNALLGAIQGGARLRKAVTHDRSAAAISGKVIGDVAPPPHINAAPRPASPPAAIAPATFSPSLRHPRMTRGSTSGHSKTESVDWYAGLAADQGAVHHLPATIEEDEEGTEEASAVPDIQVSEATSDMMDDIDKSTEFRVRSLYPYEGQRPDDLSFVENLIIIAHPSKSGGDWWYGTIVKDGKSGFFPKTYVQTVEPVKANALYSYAGGNADELPFAEGDELSIIDRGEADWWKAERDGIVFIVPAAYLEIVEAAASPHVVRVNPREKPSTNIDSVGRPDISGAAAVSGSPDEDDQADRSSDGGEDYFSMDESDDDSEGSEDGTIDDVHARELERQRVLEAAGLIVDTSSNVMAPPNLPAQKRRPPPVTPQRVSIASVTSKNLPPVPTVDLTDTELDSTSRLDDAFDRYEVFKKTNGNFNNRMSVSSSSFETSPSSPPRSPAVSLAPSLSHRDWESRTSQFLSFLGRHTNRSSTPEPEKRTLVISGPIFNTPPGGETGDESPSFGTSWASLVDKSALEGIPKMERRRQEVRVLTVLSLEYVHRTILFYSRLMGTLGEKATSVIFANIEDILLTNTTLLSVLEERQKDCRLYIDHIGDVLEAHIPNMHLYLSYCVNQSNAAKVLQSMRDSDADLATQLQHLRDDPSARNLDLSHYLLVPMQRLTRYPLLIRQILQYTDPPSTTDTTTQTTTSGHPPTISVQLPGDAEERRNISAALDAAQKILENVNETIREQEGRERLSEISKDLWIGQGRLDLTAPTRHLGPRKLLKEGAISKAKSGRKLRLFLCSDILVLTDEVGRGLYRVPIPLNEIQIKGSRNERDDSLLRLHFAYPRGGDMIVLRAASIKESVAWKDAIERASRKAKEGERRAVKALRVSSKTDLVQVS